VLHWGEAPLCEPGPGEVRVRVAYAGVNPADWKTRQGLLSRYIDYRFPFVLGFDLAGHVEAVGPGVENLQPGEAVFGATRQGEGLPGSYAPFACSYAAMLARVPQGVSLAEAAGLPTAGTTAFGALMDVGGLKPGQSVLVNGGAGGVGSLAIQIARAAGARVAATCGPANLDYVRGLGADLAIDYRSQPVTQALRAWAPAGADLVIDAVGLETLTPQALEVTAPGGTYVEIETLLGESAAEWREACARAGVRLASNMEAIQRLPQHLAGLAAGVADGRVKPAPTEVLPLGEAGQAHSRIEAGHVRGKLVLQVEPA
jgi:NADPH:quinone reductase-like Zn-dependent oxidoreductase